MEGTKSQLLTVKTAVPSADELEVEDNILKEFESQLLQQKQEEHQQSRTPSQSPASSLGRTVEGCGELCANNHQDSVVTECWEAHKQLKPTSRTASLFITSGDELATPQSHMMLENITKADSIGIHSNSTALVDDERQSFEDDTVVLHRGISQILNWFKSVLSHINCNGVVTLKDMKVAAREYEVRITLYKTLFVQLVS